MQDNLDTRDTAIRALTKIEEHMATCDRRYAESNDRMTKLFEYIKNSHEETGVKIEKINTTINQAKGMGAIAKWLVASSPVAGFLGGVAHHSIFNK